jgi:hypothetical protein
MAKKDDQLKEFKVDLNIQVDEREAVRSLQNVIKTSEKLTETSILGNKETKKTVDALIKSVKDVGDLYGKSSLRYKKALSSTQEALDAQISGEKKALKSQLKKMKILDSEVNRTRDLIMANDALEVSLKKQVKIKADLIEDEKEREDFLKQELQSIEENIALRRKEAIVLRGNRKELKKITQETAAVNANTQQTARSTRFQRFTNTAGRSLDAGGRNVLGALDYFKGGYSRAGVDSLVGSIKGANKKFGGAMQSAGSALSASRSPAAQAAAKLAGVFSKLSGVVSMVTRYLGFFAAAIMIAIEADEKQKEYYSKVSKGVGSAGMRYGDMKDLAGFGVRFAEGLDPMMLTIDEAMDGINSLMQSGVNLKSLANGFEGLKSIVDTTAIASRNFGMDTQEAGKLVGDYFQAFGAGSEKIKDVFASMNKNIKQSGMSTNQFLATLQSVSAQFNIFLDQTKEFSNVLEKMSKGGALTGKQLSKLAGVLANFGPKTVDEGLRAMALYGPQLQKQAAIEEGDVLQRLKANNYGSAAERYQDQRKLESLRVVRKGGLNAGAALPDAMGSMAVAAAFLQKRGIQTFGQMRDARNNVEQIKMMSGITGMSDNETRDFLEAVSSIMQSTGQTFDEVMQNQRDKIKQMMGDSEARRDAQQYAEATVTKISQSSDVTNSILFRISELMQMVYNLLVNIGKKMSWFGSSVEEDKTTNQVGAGKEKLEKSVAETFKDAKGAKSLLTSDAEQDRSVSQFAPLNANMNQYLGLDKQAVNVKGKGRGRGRGKTVTPPTSLNVGDVSRQPQNYTPAATKNDFTGLNAASSTAASNAPVNMSAVLQLPDNKPIELIVNKVIYDREKRK